MNTVYIIAAIIVLGALFIPRTIELVNLHIIQGISYVASDVENYHSNAHPIEGKYTIEIDLRNLASNEGEVLFDDGENQIYVSKVIVHSETDYELFFRSSGSYSLGGATLVSGVDHTYNNDRFKSRFQAEAKATFRDDTYTLSPSGSSGLNYRNGDEFGFYLELPDEAVLDFEKEVMIDVAVTNLYVNLWAEIPN